MRIQVREQGRYQGGRPLYGYRLVDAGPHPNRAHARWGRRLHRLDLDPATAPHVRRMFARRLDGWAVSKIARTLNERGVPCPSQVDRARNWHRSATEWTERTVAEILGNPRYTGRQVWIRQGTERLAAGPGKACRKIRHRNQASEWEISAKVAHPALVSEDDFITVQGMRVARRAKDGTCRTYRLSGHLVCGICAPADGRALGPRTPRLPVPSRPHQRQDPRSGPSEEPLRP